MKKRYTGKRITQPGRTTSRRQHGINKSSNDENGMEDQLKTDVFDNGIRFTTAEILDISEGTDSYF